MSFTVYVTRDFNRMSRVAAGLVVRDIKRKKGRYTLGLATGNTPVGLYRNLADAFNKGVVSPRHITTFNLDEYVGLPGGNVTERLLHPESYAYFMTQQLFGLMKDKFRKTHVPRGGEIDQRLLVREMRKHRGDWHEEGEDKGKAVVIHAAARSAYLRQVRREILDGYAAGIRRAGGIDLHVVGVGGKGHIAFHESGIPLRRTMLLVKLDDNTIRNAVADGHFPSLKEVPRYAVSMGAGLTYLARTVLLLASGPRKREPIAASLLGRVTADIPISFSQRYAARGGNMIYVVDREAAAGLKGREGELRKKGIHLRTL